ncbi:MAG: hypothetical protein IJO32_01610 [Bacilli bacterium]|nr:hypothetical protein [Bacilli bacterium]
MKIGIPKALMYYKYGYLWKKYFDYLGIEYIVSENSNKNIIELGKKHSTDETCIPFKIYMGHVNSLKNKCDYILVPRFLGEKKDRIDCIKFNSIYDVVNNSFDNLNLIEYNIDYTENKYEFLEFIKLGKKLNKKTIECFFAYKKAKKKYLKYRKQQEEKQEQLIKNSNNKKILLLGHSYNLHDNVIGKPIIKILKQYDIDIIYSDFHNSKKDNSSKISETLYWTSNKDLINSLLHYKEKVDGIIILTAFPCGNDCLVNELIIRKTKDIPLINIVVDELNSEAGLVTRLESFIDIIDERRNINEKSNKFSKSR